MRGCPAKGTVSAQLMTIQHTIQPNCHNGKAGGGPAQPTGSCLICLYFIFKFKLLRESQEHEDYAHTYVKADGLKNYCYCYKLL